MASILVIGASKGIGLETVKRALEAGHVVRALARGAHEIAIDNGRLQKIAGSALDPAAVAEAVRGVDAVIMALGTTNLLNPGRLFSDATRIAIDAMQAAGVKRLIVVTGLGAGDSRGKGGALYDWVFFPLVLSRVYADKDVQERMVRASGLDWTIVRPGLLTSGALTRRYRALGEPKDWRAGSISRADVADFLVAQVESREWLGRTPLLIA
jgi:putative NADH-flavin reductase